MKKTPAVIDFFDGTKYDFLSNFHPARITYEGLEWKTTEHAYQAMKSRDPADWKYIQRASTPGKAKMLGKTRLQMRPDWDTIKYDIMLDLLRLKFKIPALRKKLLDTGDAKLIEGNTWNDTCWGVCEGVGANNLGRSLMLVRAEIRVEELLTVCAS